MLVNPVDEKGVGNFELDAVGLQPDGLDRFEPGVEGLFAAQTATNGHEDLSPESTRFLQLRGLRGHVSSGPCSEEVSRRSRRACDPLGSVIDGKPSGGVELCGKLGCDLFTWGPSALS